MTPIKIFFVEPTGTMMYSYSFKCEPCDHITRVDIGEITGNRLPSIDDWSKVTHPCEKCGQEVKLCSTGGSTIFRRPDTGEIFGDGVALPPDAVYDATWCHDFPDECGPDGRCLVAVLPNGHHWYIDSRASNCTLPEDKVHRCWVRHGRPEDGTLHVDKNGVTCAAGAGSIQMDDFHGFLHHGMITG
jgi:hypothetical protein